MSSLPPNLHKQCLPESAELLYRQAIRQADPDLRSRVWNQSTRSSLKEAHAQHCNFQYRWRTRAPRHPSSAWAAESPFWKVSSSGQEVSLVFWGNSLLHKHWKLCCLHFYCSSPTRSTALTTSRITEHRLKSEACALFCT
jgi:hypothetical protein